MNAVITKEATSVAEYEQRSEPNTFLNMLQAAVSQGADIERIRELRQMQKEWQADQAEMAFDLAMSEFKRNPPQVIHDMENKQYKSTYSSLANFVGTVNRALGEHGLSASWELDQSSGIKITCVLAHRMGHKKRVTMVGPPDTSGAKNPLQQIKSTMTYLELATFQAVTGIVAAAANEDDDGNQSGDEPKTIIEQRVPQSTNTGGSFATGKQVDLIRKKLERAGLSAEQLCKHFGIDSVPQLPFEKVNEALSWVQKAE